MMRLCICVYALLLLLPMEAKSGSSELELQGEWRFRMDRQDAGVEQKWFTEVLSDGITLPGSLQNQGFGDRPTKGSDWTGGIGIRLLEDPRFQRYLGDEDFKCPFWLTPTRHYVGTAWYQRDVKIPESWSDRRIVLLLERPHWETTLWVGDQEIGKRDGLGVPHRYDLTDVLRTGSNRLTIRVDNRVVVPVGNDAHSVSDQTQGNWNGIVGDLRLFATDRVWIEDVQVYPDLEQKSARLKVKLGNHTGKPGKGVLTVRAETTNAEAAHEAEAKSWQVAWEDEGAELEFEYPLGEEAQLWDEYSPVVYKLNAELRRDAEQDKAAEFSTSFGLREFSIAGTQFTLNGRNVFLRGTLECAVFPETGYPATDLASWKKILRVCKAHGLNHIRFHSWCPPKAAFIAADELGFFFEVECSAWANFGYGTAVDTWIHEESARMLKEYGNHPSFVLMAASNEPHGTNRAAVLEPLVRSWAAEDPRHYYTCGAGWPHLPANQFHINQEARLQRFVPLRLDHKPQSAADYRQIIEENDIPIITHEIGQWCVYPNLAERLKYTGFFKAKNLDVFRDLLDRAGMVDQAADFLLASGKFQALLYKQEIEAALRTPGQAGIQLLSLQDFPGQGTAPVGVLDALWDSKGYISPEEFRSFCNHTVILARMPRFVWTNDETFEASVDVANYGPEDLSGAQVSWRLATPEGQVCAEGLLDSQEMPTGSVTKVGEIAVDLSKLQAPTRLVFSTALVNSDITNEWSVWVYPDTVEADPPADMVVSSDLEETMEALERGERVLFLPPHYTIRGQTFGTFRPVFWNRITFPSQQEHTLGVLCQADHPAFAEFPTSFHTDWNWWELFERSKPMVLDEVPAPYRPIVQPIDDWNDCRRLALLTEARIGSGRLMICAMDIESDLDERPVARQLRRSLLSYMVSDDFAPADEWTPDHVRSLFREPSAIQRLGATVAANCHEPLHEANQTLDGNPKTIWSSTRMPSPAPMPHHLVVDLKQTVTLGGMTYLPRQNSSSGRIADYEVLASDDGENWSRPIASGRWPDDAVLKKVRFEEPQQCRFIKLVALSATNGQALATAAEIGVLLEP